MKVEALPQRVLRQRMIVALVSGEPLLGVDLLFGASAVLMLEQRFVTHPLDACSKNRSSLIPWEMFES